jgi:hypothetical protein
MMPAGVAARLRAAAARLKLSIINRARNAFHLLKLFCLWLKRLWFWAWKPYPVYLTVLAVALPFVASFYWPDEDTIRRSGLWLELLGIYTVWLGIEETRKLFGHPPFLKQARQRVRQWWQARPPFRRGVTVGIGAASIGVSGARARGSVWNNAPPDATVEQRLDAMEKNLTRVRDDLARFEGKTDDEFAKQTETLKQEQQSRATADQELRDLLTATETGGLHITMAGAIFLFAGVVMSTVPVELADYLFKPVNGFLLN